MLMIGVGTDIVAVPRFARLLERGGSRFVARWFTAAEAYYCLERSAPERHLAARFAAKEATLKSLRQAWSGPLRWRQIEIVRDPQGRPDTLLHGDMHVLATAAGVRHLHLSISHDANYATATVLALGAD